MKKMDLFTTGSDWTLFELFAPWDPKIFLRAATSCTVSHPLLLHPLFYKCFCNAHTWRLPIYGSVFRQERRIVLILDSITVQKNKPWLWLTSLSLKSSDVLWDILKIIFHLKYGKLWYVTSKKSAAIFLTRILP